MAQACCKSVFCGVFYQPSEDGLQLLRGAVRMAMSFAKDDAFSLWYPGRFATDSDWLFLLVRSAWILQAASTKSQVT